MAPKFPPSLKFLDGDPREAKLSSRSASESVGCPASLS